MRFVATSLADAYLVHATSHEDERGFFARIRCSQEFAEHELPAEFVQTNLSHNAVAGTFRGLHYQVPPSREGKLVRCVAGSIDDVIVDLRPGSPSFLGHEWFRLGDRGLSGLYVPPGFAHGFLTRSDETTVMYEMTDYYAPELARGVRWSDAQLRLRLPGAIRVIHPRDASYSDLDVESLAFFRGFSRGA
jgi:dTDP-4-dehydrorhamnose 3,5-epimerase